MDSHTSLTFRPWSRRSHYLN